MQRVKNNTIRILQIVSLVAMLGFAWISNTNAQQDETMPSPTNFVFDEADITESSFTDEKTNIFNTIYNQASPSVVAINITVRNGRFTTTGTGSGFIIDTAGHIVTNNHVVEDAHAIEVEFFDGTLTSAAIVGVDADSDLAVLVVDSDVTELIPLEFGDIDNLIIGETVLAIGSPYGQDWTLTTGIVSGLNRTITGLSSFSIGGVIQTDAAINPGNSGGPLLNLKGQVIGVNSQILSDSGSNSGVGFAIPGNLVQRVAQELIANGKVSYSYIGIVGVDINLSLIDSLDLPSDMRGVLIRDIVQRSPAEVAGLQPVNANNSDDFDIIIEIDGTSIKTMDELISYLSAQTTPGDTITLKIWRQNQVLVRTVTLTSRP